MTTAPVAVAREERTWGGDTTQRRPQRRLSGSHSPELLYVGDRGRHDLDPEPEGPLFGVPVRGPHMTPTSGSRRLRPCRMQGPRVFEPGLKAEPFTYTSSLQGIKKN